MDMSAASQEYSGIKLALREIQQNIAEAKARRQKEGKENNVTLVAVSKKKPVDLIVEAYKEGQRDFGENYVAELIEKANDPYICSSCPDIQWHFIGHLQSNKVKKLVQGCPNLYMVQSVDSVKVADILNSCWGNSSRLARVMVQVNTSQEENKSGTNAQEVDRLVNHILSNCPNLHFVGLMTIGSANYDCKDGPNPDYITLIKIQSQLCEKFRFDTFDLSFGMSKDYQHAIELGSSYIRVGEKIFGPRLPPTVTSQKKPEMDPNAG